jgi:4-hydroxy-3-polyprenylbenzoate decarboxylase
MPAFYTLPKTVGEVVDQTVARVLDRFIIEHQLAPQWGEAR